MLTPTSPEAYAGVIPRVICADMDGTLLNSQSAIPEGFWPLLDELRVQSIPFVVASGRQYQSLCHIFGAYAKNMPIIADNGAYVMYGGEEISSRVLSREFVVSTVTYLHELIAEGAPIALVVAGKKYGYIENEDPIFMSYVQHYYHSRKLCADILDYDDEIVKIAIFDFSGAQTGVFPQLRHLQRTHEVVLSGEQWVDIMDPRVNKGEATREILAAFNVKPSETAAFGDFFNDKEMLESVGLSFLMANGHPELRSSARFVAPSNDEAGLIQTVWTMLGQTSTQR